MSKAYDAIVAAAQREAKLKLAQMQALISMGGKATPYSYGCLSADQTKIIFPDGSIGNAVIAGIPNQCGPVTQIGPGTYLVSGPAPQYSTITGGAKGYVIALTNGVYTIERIGGVLPESYLLDIAAILPGANYETATVTFTQSNNHIMVINSGFPVGEPLTGLTYAFAINWSLGQDSFGNNVVLWDSISSYTVTATFPEPLAPDTPSLPPPYQASPSVFGVGYPTGIIDYLIWEAEDDETILNEVTVTLPPVSYDIGYFLVQFEDAENVPHLDIVGNWNVTKITPFTFRPKACFSLESRSQAPDPTWPVVGGGDPGVMPITYGAVKLDTATQQYYREVSSPNFSIYNNSGTDTPYDLDIYLVGGSAHIAVPTGNNPNGIGNAYDQDNLVTTFVINSGRDIGPPLSPTNINYIVEGGGGYRNNTYYPSTSTTTTDGKGFDYTSVSNNACAVGNASGNIWKHWWSQAVELTPPQTGYFTNFVTASNGYPHSQGAWTIPGWKSDPYPSAWEVTSATGYRGKGLIDPQAANSTLIITDYTLYNQVSQNYMFAITNDGAELDYSTELNVAENQTYSYLSSDPNFQGPCAIFNCTITSTGTSWGFSSSGLPMRQDFFKKYTDQGTVIATVKTNSAEQEVSGNGFQLGPYRFYTSTYGSGSDYLVKGTSLTIPAAPDPVPNPTLGTIAFPYIATDDLVIIGYLHIG